jgi:hypothetical protein
MDRVVRRVRSARDRVPDEQSVYDSNDLRVGRPGFKPTEEIASQRDGVEAVVPTSGTIRYGGGLLTQRPAIDMDALTVACIAMSRIVHGMQCHVIDLEAFLKDRNDIQVRTFTLPTVVLEYPRTEDEQRCPLVVIEQGSEVTYGSSGEVAHLLEDTYDRFFPNTVLRSIASASVELIVTVTLGHKDERRAVRACFERSLLAEPDSEKHARRVVVRENFDQQVRLQLLGSSSPQQTDAQSNRWAYAARVLAEVERVELVGPPPLIEEPRFGLKL